MLLLLIVVTGLLTGVGVSAWVEAQDLARRADSEASERRRGQGSTHCQQPVADPILPTRFPEALR